MVKFRPTCTGTLTPSISTLILLLRYQPSDPVENSLTSASSLLSPICTTIGLALVRKSARLIGQVVFFAIAASSPQVGLTLTRGEPDMCPPPEARAPRAMPGVWYEAHAG